MNITTVVRVFDEAGSLDHIESYRKGVSLPRWGREVVDQSAPWMKVAAYAVAAAVCIVCAVGWL